MRLPDFESMDQPDVETFVVDDDKKAEWALRKLARIRSAGPRVADVYAAERERLDQWRDQELARIELDGAYFVSQLDLYAREQRANGDRKTITLPHGVVSTTHRKARVQVDDAGAVLEWAKQNRPELVRVKESVPVSEISLVALLDGGVRDPDTGHEIPGASLLPEAVSVTIKTPTTEGQN
jgi:hypothetical protein